jgi:hypothetical protein
MASRKPDSSYWLDFQFSSDTPLHFDSPDSVMTTVRSLPARSPDGTTWGASNDLAIGEIVSWIFNHMRVGIA